jgi:phage antirepressor YoqD-like protein
MTDEEVLANALILANNVITTRNERIKVLETQNKQLLEENEAAKPKVQYFDFLIDKSLLTNFTTTAKELGIKPKQLITYLLDNKYIYRNSKSTLLPYQSHCNSGLFEIKETANHRTNWAGTQTLVTPKGRQTLQMLLSVPGALDHITTIAEEEQPA